MPLLFVEGVFFKFKPIRKIFHFFNSLAAGIQLSFHIITHIPIKGKPCILLFFFWTVLFSVLPDYSLANSTDRPLRHGLSGVPAFASIAPGNGCAAPPIPRMLRLKKSLRGSLLVGKEEKPFPEPARKQSLHEFFPGLQNRCAILPQLSRPPWLFTGWQETIPFPEPVEGDICKPKPSLKNANRHPELDSGSVLKGPLTATDSGRARNPMILSRG